MLENMNTAGNETTAIEQLRDTSFSKLTVLHPNLAPHERYHQTYFERYTACSNEKEKIAEAIIRISLNTGNQALLDLGSGDGALTRMLADTFKHITAVEKNPSYKNNLDDLRNVGTIISLMEDYSPERLFNIILMSYSLSGIRAEHLKSVLNKLSDSLAPNGKMLFVTYAGGCPWDQFGKVVRGSLEIPETGGTDLHLKQLKAVNRKTEVLETIPSLIKGRDLNDLVNKLGFFFLRNIEGYHANIEAFSRILKPLTIELPSGEKALEIKQNIIEII